MMHTLLPTMISPLVPFAPLFSARVWRHVLVLVTGTLLTPGKRTVCAALRAMGLSGCKEFSRYHRVLSRARWSSLAVARVLLGLLVAVFAPVGPLVFGLDETIERRWGPKIAAKGLYRDAVRSSKDYFVKVSGLRWLSLMLLVPIPWAQRVWALPCLTILAPSARYDRERRRRHKKLTDWARQLLLQLRRWLPDRALVVVADSGYAAIELLARCARLARPIAVVTRLRLDAALYEPAPPRRPRQNGRPRLKGARLPTLAVRTADPTTAWGTVTVANWYGEGARTVEVASATAVWYHAGLPPLPIRWVLVRDPHGQFATQALLCTDLTTEPAQVLAWFVLRWQLEVTFEEARRHLGVETQRQWSDLAILRTTPALLGLFSLVTLWAHSQMGGTRALVRQAAWYPKALPTFSDALALVRRELWRHMAFSMSSCAPDTVEVPRALAERFMDALCYAA
ncbi:MAG TPA: transposase [Thermomicrobiales bacterium]|nr:transposase [Thermomicrobiales bacterium]